jgi:hypothetical protein
MPSFYSADDRVLRGNSMNARRANVLLVIVIAILVAGLGMAAVQYSRAKAAREETKNNLSKMGRALHSYADREDHHLPPAFDRDKSIPYPVSIHVHLLADLSQQELFNSFSLEGQGNVDAAVPAYLAPDDGTLGKVVGVQNFAANLRLFSKKGASAGAGHDMSPLAPVEPGSVFSIYSIIRGTSNTIAFATKLAQCSDGGRRYADDPTSPWAAFFGQNVATTTAQFSNPKAIYQWAPRGNECLTRPLMAQTYLPRPLLVGMADGSAREVKGDVDPEIRNEVMNPW